MAATSDEGGCGCLIVVILALVGWFLYDGHAKREARAADAVADADYAQSQADTSKAEADRLRRENEDLRSENARLREELSDMTSRSTAQ